MLCLLLAQNKFFAAPDKVLAAKTLRSAAKRIGEPAKLPLYTAATLGLAKVSSGIG